MEKVTIFYVLFLFFLIYILELDDKYTPLIGTDKLESNSTLSICNLCCFQNPKKETQAPRQRPALPKFTTVTSVMRT